MPYEIKNKLRGPSTLRITGVDSTGALALSAFSANANTENVSSLVVTQVEWSVLPATGTLVITRNALVVATLYETGVWKRDEMTISNTATGSITVAITGGGTAILTLSKEAVYNVQTQSL